ncbi:hypothetical protein ACFVWX_23090 [Streptomyces sp. NPDC058220]|uniref:hypothetical protein n=1 Tax=Streptomyces sp. NPDC058220 TaxID=3346387 RepID=UPI0036EB6479
MERTAQESRLAALKKDLPPEKRAFAEDLRKVFLVLEVSVRRYAARRIMDASTVTRYLSGDRVPPWDFVAAVIADAREGGVALTFETEAALRDLHRAAQKSNRRDSEKQALQDQLAEVDEESRRIRARQRALEEALLDRQKRLAEAQSRCHSLVLELEGQWLTHRAEVDLWQGEYDELRSECEDLQEQVVFLQEALAVARAEQVAAEDQCVRLEAQLEQLQELRGDDQSRLSLMAALDATDRTASVPELIAVVSDLESRTQRAMASELVTSVSRSREVREVAALLSALHGAGLHAHAESALPAMVMMRPVEDTAAMALELRAVGLEEYVVMVLRASIELHTPHDLAALVSCLHGAGQHEYAKSLVGAACVARPVVEVAAVLSRLRDQGLDSLLSAALDAMAGQRAVGDIVALSQAMHDVGWHHLPGVLASSVAGRRPATDVAELIEELARCGLEREADVVFLSTQSRRVEHLIALVSALQSTNKHAAAASVLFRAITTRPLADITALITDLHATGRHQQASDALITALRTVDTGDLTDQLGSLDKTYPGSHTLLEGATRQASPEEAAGMFLALEASALPHHADIVFECTLRERPTGHAGIFLNLLRGSQSHYTSILALRERARADQATAVTASLILALTSGELLFELDAVLDSAIENEAADIAMLLRQLRKLDNPKMPLVGAIARRMLNGTLRVRTVSEHVSLVMALETAELTEHSSDLVAAATALYARQFTDALKKERTKHEQKILSRAFWRKTPAAAK